MTARIVGVYLQAKVKVEEFWTSPRPWCFSDCIVSPKTSAASPIERMKTKSMYDHRRPIGSQSQIDSMLLKLRGPSRCRVGRYTEPMVAALLRMTDPTGLGIWMLFRYAASWALNSMRGLRGIRGGGISFAWYWLTSREIELTTSSAE
jgi:hypothetical protein